MATVPEETLAQLHPLEIRALPHLESGTTVKELAKRAGMQEVEAMRACQWLQNKEALDFSPQSLHEIELGPNGEKALEQGLPELRFLAAAREGAGTKDAIAKKASLDPQEAAASMGLLKKRGLITIEKGKIALTPEGNKAGTKDSSEIRLLQKAAKTPLVLEDLKGEERDAAASLRGRKGYLVVRERKDHAITLTPLGEALREVDASALDFEERLTREDLETGAWKEKRYRAFDVRVPVPARSGGKIHFVQEAIDYTRRIWIEMGFTEMTGEMVQSAFWDMDALFVPQDHPAREMQDTFYLEERTQIDKVAYEKVKAVHEHGANTGSKGWGTRFEKGKAEQLLLRTHTTVLSARTLWAIREGRLPMPGKYFAIGKNFRNEKMDWKHAFEFNQVEGIVVDKNVTFAHLLSYLRTFFSKMGFPDIRLRPSHFPYTEPSVEIDVWHPRREQWVELGGAGMFRPEVTKTLLGEEIPVLAWGPGFDRIIMDYFEIQDIRDLYKNDIAQLRSMKRYLRLEG